ncbi:hypothetical protein DdX_08908 [Ditylenchus destructor]|uniref:Uncharacterized protein n=1 Tax=Ditylenchus destructor TaxID=166010 RepID=A0AAD4N3V3_9BILA|nr:hypothetical protein DdX_08908 [Ditylenchus destructor]
MVGPRQTMIYDPWTFQENNPQYRICCGLFHVKDVIIVFTILKTTLLLLYVVWKMCGTQDFAMFTLASIFGLSMILGSYIFLVIGVIVKKYSLLTPYFTLCILLILILILKLFMEVMGTANTKSTLETRQLARILAQAAMIMVEIYSVYIVWKVFNYITDSYMENDNLAIKRMQDRRLQYEVELGISTRKPKNVTITSSPFHNAAASLIINPNRKPSTKAATYKATPSGRAYKPSAFNTKITDEKRKASSQFSTSTATSTF